jgi:hypothetical protein
MIETPLFGLFPPGYVAEGRINLSQLIRSDTGRPSANPSSRIADARPLQASASSEAEFLAEHGFVLLDAPTAVSDWSDADEVERHYLPEIDALIRTRLYPGRRLEIIQPPRVGRRGRGTDMPQYGTGVHQDHGTTADDFEHNVRAFTSPEIGARWRAGFERDDVAGFVSLDFWRTTGMAGPLKHMPLALCDPTSIDPADIIPTALEGIAPGGAATHHISLRYNSGQLWYYYPDMTADELLVFKLFELTRDAEPQPYRACFHTAVADPSAPPDAQPRQSCEHRVSVMLLRD